MIFNRSPLTMIQGCCVRIRNEAAAIGSIEWSWSNVTCAIAVMAARLNSIPAEVYVSQASLCVRRPHAHLARVSFSPCISCMECVMTLLLRTLVLHFINVGVRWYIWVCAACSMAIVAPRNTIEWFGLNVMYALPSAVLKIWRCVIAGDFQSTLERPGAS